jgi:transcriptional regulator with PAS, ATPase and Fis domain
MNEHAWYKAFPGAITVTDQDGFILEMNDGSAEMFKNDGGYALIGHNAITCHKEPTQTKVRKIYDTQQPNIYSIQKNGKKTLVYQTPYFIEGVFSGVVEICLDLPEEIPHFNRDAPKPNL